MPDVVPSKQAEHMIKALAWKAEQLESQAMDAEGPTAEMLRADADFFLQTVSQLRGERIPLRDDEVKRDLVFTRSLSIPP